MSQNRTSPEFGATSGTGTPGSSNASNTPTTASANTGGTAAGTATGLAQEYGSKITDAATHAKEFVTEKVSVVGDKLKDLQNVDYREMAENAKDYARQNPGQAILISAAAGLLLGLIIRGRR